MAEGNGGNPNAVNSSASAIHDAVTGRSAETEATDADDSPGQTETGESKSAIQRRAESYADTMERCAAGDLSARMDTDGDDEPMDRMAREFNQLADELETTTTHLKSYVEEVESAGVSVEQSADAAQRASEDVIDSMQNIAGDAETQRERLGDIAAAIDEVVATLEEQTERDSGAEFDTQASRLEERASELRDVAETSETIQTETTIVSAAVQEQAAELSEVSSRASDLQRYANPLSAMLDRFETESHSGRSNGGETGN